MTIWTFGDSFSKHFKKSKHFNNLSDTWIERISHKLDQPVISNSKPLLTLEHTFENFNNMRKEIKENDVVIITITNIDRRWFFRDHPLKVLYLNTIEQKAVNNCSHLDNLLETQETYIINFLYNLNTITRKLNLHTIVLPSFYDAEVLLNKIKLNFNDLHFSDISLGTVSYNEFLEGYSLPDFGKDPRVNHLTKNNHIILSHKILENIQNKKLIELTSGFENNFIDQNLLNDPFFKKEQLFDEIMSRIQRIKINRAL